MSIGLDDELTAQLVVEIEVADLARTINFYDRLGFQLVRCSGNFASLRFGSGWLFVTRGPRASANAASGTNLRVVVSDIDATWAAATQTGASIERPIADRSYGLRDFTIRDPDGFALRFAARLP
jgi:catechol 2,3-dioxygenase-like lactoylglutathione lyase family enzyme